MTIATTSCDVIKDVQWPSPKNLQVVTAGFFLFHWFLFYLSNVKSDYCRAFVFAHAFGKINVNWELKRMLSAKLRISGYIRALLRAFAHDCAHLLTTAYNCAHPGTTAHIYARPYIHQVRFQVCSHVRFCNIYREKVIFGNCTLFAHFSAHLYTFGFFLSCRIRQ